MNANGKPNGEGASDNWKVSTYVAGGALGLLAGLLSAYLYARSAEENQKGGRPGRISTGDIFKLGLAAISLIRLISDLGAKKSDSRN